jgi:ABC-type amino acid transport substrate-binding protein
VAVRGSALAVVLAVVLAGCAPGSAPQQPLKPKLKPPAIGKAGVLRVAVDAHYPPFASLEGSAIVGIDADVAFALAQQLRLTPVLVDVPSTGTADALHAKRVDVALGGVSITKAAVSDVAIATSYLSDVPGIFVPKSGGTAFDLATMKIAAQQGSQAYWLLKGRVPDANLITFPTLREAFEALSDGRADAVAGDGIVGGYISRDFPGVVMTAQLADAVPLAVMVARDDAVLEPAVRGAVDALAGGGVLDAIRHKWLGALVPFGSAASSNAATPTR